MHCCFYHQKKRKNLNTFASAGCCNSWHNISERKLTQGEQNYHKDAITEVQALTCLKERWTRYCFLERCSIYPEVLEVTARAILFHGKKGLALRGHKKSYKKKLTIKT